MPKRKALYVALAATAGTLASGLIATGALAQEPEPTTYVDWPVPALAGWNVEANALTVDAASPDGRTYIYPDAGARDDDTGGDGSGSIAFVPWSLDDGSGRAPGIQTVTNDLAFPVHNCIMASGERESEEFPGTIVPKTCSDDPGSSKRYFLEITEADEPIDLVFDTGEAVIRYKGVREPGEDGYTIDDFRDEFGIGRIYRVIQKFVNDTDERLLGVQVEVGTGVGDAFTPLGIEDGVAFELRTFVDREFFVGSTGADDRTVWQPDRFAHFSPKLFDDGSRERFEPGFFDHQAAGLFPPQDFEEGDKTRYIYSGEQQVNDAQFGAITPNYFDMASNQELNAGIAGNPFGYMLPESLAPTVIERHDDGDPTTEGDAIMAWWDGEHWRYGLDGDFAEVPEDELRQWAALLLGYDGAAEDPARYGMEEAFDDLSAINSDVYLYLDENFNVEEHSTLTLRITPVSTDPGLHGDQGNEEPLWVENPATPLESYMPETGEPVAINDYATLVRPDELEVDIDVLANDLLDGELLTSRVEDAEDELTMDDITVNVVTQPGNGTASEAANGVVTYEPDESFSGEDSFTYSVTLYEGTDEEVTSNTATVRITVVPEPVPDAPIASNDWAITLLTEPVAINVLANDTVMGDLIDPAQATVAVRDAPLNGTAIPDADSNIVYTANPGFVGFDRFTYTVTVNDLESNAALVTVRVDDEDEAAPDPDEPLEPEEPFGRDSGGGGCSIAGAGRFDPLLPATLLLALGYLGLRRRRT